MKIEDLNSITQILESMDLAIKELEKAIEKKDVERIRESKKEILNFHGEIKKILGG